MGLSAFRNNCKTCRSQMSAIVSWQCTYQGVRPSASHCSACKPACIPTGLGQPLCRDYHENPSLWVLA